MLSLVNLTQRPLVVDVEVPGMPMTCLGVLGVGRSMPIGERQLSGGLRLTDVTGGWNSASVASVAVALDEADAAEAAGACMRPTVWLPRIMDAKLGRAADSATEGEETQWRAQFAVAERSPPPCEHLVRTFTCSLVERATVPGRSCATTHHPLPTSRYQLLASHYLHYLPPTMHSTLPTARLTLSTLHNIYTTYRPLLSHSPLPTARIALPTLPAAHSPLPTAHLTLPTLPTHYPLLA